MNTKATVVPVSTARCVIGTAGHIDHGKTSLVFALTGIDTDRLAVEKQRGITTELGFAQSTLNVEGVPTRVAFVDVPGHERFVEAMVGGAAGMDLVCLVVDAVEGVKPQTREHVDICELLGVSTMVVALTKADKASGAQAASAKRQVQALLRTTRFAGAAVVRTSAVTQLGLDELRQQLASAVAGVRRNDAHRVLQLPIDRVFTMQGVGTVVTGTVRGCGIEVGDRVQIGARRARVRGLHQHGQRVERALSGQRVAANLVGLGSTLVVDELRRGQVVCHEDALIPSHIVDVAFTYVAAARAALRLPADVVVHAGTAHVAGRLIGATTTAVAPGETVLAQLRVPQHMPLWVVRGEHFVVRGARVVGDAGRTLGGGWFVRTVAAKLRRIRPVEGHAAVQASVDGDAQARSSGASASEATAWRAVPDARTHVGFEVQQRGGVGIAEAELAARLGLTLEATLAALQARAVPLARWIAASNVVDVGAVAAVFFDDEARRRWYEARRLAQVVQTTRELVSRQRLVPREHALRVCAGHVREPDALLWCWRQMAAAQQLVLIDNELCAYGVMARAAAAEDGAGASERGVGDKTAASGGAASASRCEAHVLEALVALGLQGAAPQGLPALLTTRIHQYGVQLAAASDGAEDSRPGSGSARAPASTGDVTLPMVQAALAALARRSEIVRILPDYYVAAVHVHKLAARLRDHFARHAELSPADLKHLVGLSRKHVIALAEYFDAQKLTVRTGDTRRLRAAAH